MASIEKRGGRFSVRYRDPVTGKNRRRTFAREREAIAFRAQCEVDIGRGSFVSPSDGDRRFGEALEEWLESKRSRQDYQDVLLIVARKWLGLPYADGTVRCAASGRPLAEVRIGRITPDHIDGVLRDMRCAGRASAYRLKAFQIIDGTFRMTIRQRRLIHNPCELVTERPSPAARRKAQPLSEEMFGRIVELMPSERDRVLVWWLAYTGSRPVEALSLRVGDVDLAARKVVLPTAKGHDGRERPRVVGLAGKLIQVLQPYLAGRSGEEALFPHRAEDPLEPLNYPSWRLNVWNPVRDRLGITATPYTLRHTCASWLLAKGATLVDLQEWMGHTKASTTSDIYAHLLDPDEHAHRLADLLD